jgi:flagellar FliL protein
MSIVDTGPDSTSAEGTGPRSRKRLLVAVVVILALAGTGWWWFMIRPAGAEEAPEPGEVVQLEAIQINLAGGHYLRVGIALQGTEDGGAELEGSKALDATIELFSGKSVHDLARQPYRTRLKHQLLEELDERYEGEVIAVYFTDFVTQ